MTVTAFGTPLTSAPLIEVSEFSADQNYQSNLRAIHRNMNDFLKSNSGLSKIGNEKVSKMSVNYVEIGSILDRVEVEGKFNEIDLLRMNQIVDSNLETLTELDLKRSTSDFKKSLLTELFDVKDNMTKSIIDTDIEEKSLELANASRSYQINQQMLINFGLSQSEHKSRLISMLVR